MSHEGEGELAWLQGRLREQGFRMPAEWETHAACWMAWPERPDNWRANAVPIQEAFVEVISAIREFEPVTVLASTQQWERARRMLPSLVRVVECTANDCWMRDMGPTFVVRNAKGGAETPSEQSKELVAVDWKFNAWGGVEEGCYSDWSLDSLVPAKICEVLGGVKRVSTSMVMEGGSFHVDGEGTLLTTEECLLNPNRNPDLTKKDIEQRLSACLGVESFLWLPHGLVGDEDTNGHVDNIACFAAPGVVLLSWTDDPTHPQFQVCAEALSVLNGSRDAKGRRIRVVKLPLPPVMHYTEEEVQSLCLGPGTGSATREAGQLLPATYVNFYLPNGGVVAPAFGIPESDQAAKEVLETTFPDRKVVMVSRGREIILGGGNVHCITQQQPRV